MSTYQEARQEAYRLIRTTHCVACQRRPSLTKDGGWPVARCLEHPDARLEQRMTTEESTAVTTRELSTEEIAEGAKALLARPEAKFLSDRDLTKQDNGQQLARLLVAYAAAEGLNPYAGEVMIFQGKPYKTLPGVIAQAQRRGRVDFGPYEQPVTPEEAAQIQAQIPPKEDGSEDRAYIAKVVLKLRGSTQPQTHFSHVLDSEREGAKASELNSQYESTRKKARAGQFKQPIVKHTQKLALARAKRKALIDSGAASGEDMGELDRVAAISEIQAFGLTVETQTMPEPAPDQLEEGQLPFEPTPAELAAGPEQPEASEDPEAAEGGDNTAVLAATQSAEPIETTAETLPEDPFAHDAAGEADGREEAHPWDPPEGHKYSDVGSGVQIFRFAHEIGFPTFNSVCAVLLLEAAGEDREERNQRFIATDMLCEMWSGPAVAWTVERLFDLIEALPDVGWDDDDKVREMTLSWHQAGARDGDRAYNTQAVENAAAS